MKYWAIKDEYDELIIETVSNVAAYSIAKLVNDCGQDWKYWKANGYRCVKVTITKGWE